MSNLINLPPQQLSFNRKNKKWRKTHLDWAESKTFFNFSLVRKSVIHKKINYDLLNGKLHMTDLELIVNPESLKAGFIPDRIQHYPIMNVKLELLAGEEYKRVFDYRVIVTNPNSISEIENNKKEQLSQHIIELIQSSAQSEEQFNEELSKIEKYYSYEWQDLREIRANSLMQHYLKEYNIPLLFNQGFFDALAVGEEIYQCDIVGGEPYIERVNPLKIRVFQSGYSNKIEDADIIIMEDYWSPGRVIDTYYDVLTKKDMEYIEKIPNHVGQSSVDTMDNVDERYGFVNSAMVGEELGTDGFYFDPLNLFNDQVSNSLLPYDLAGNIRVIKMYWKSRRKIKKVKSYDQETGEEIFNFYPETYVIDETMGEEEEILFINEAWEGTKIGSDIYVNMRPRPIQYNRLSDPSRCHFGIIGSIYNLNESKPFSLVDQMKQYNYAYDVIHDRLNKMLARNWGKLIKIDFAKIPKGWDMEKWLYYAKVSGIAVEDSFKEGNVGVATGKIAGSLNNASSGIIDADWGNNIQQHINLLEYIKNEMSEVVGISKQREGQISNRETVGGVERATLQSSHITEWLYATHEDLKRRVLECFLETSKIALKGRSKKFQYILSDHSMKIMDIDGDEFAENDYGLVVDNSQKTQELNQKLDMLAQAALQNQALNFSTIMKLYSSSSLAEKQRMVEQNEQELKEQAQQQQQQQAQLQQQQMEQQAQMAQAQMEQQVAMNQEDNETKVLVANINAQAKLESNIQGPAEFTEESRAKLIQQMKEFDEKIKLDREKFEFEKKKHSEDNALKDKISLRQSQSRNYKT